MQNSVAPVAAVSRAASTSDGMSSRTARTGVSKRPDWRAEVAVLGAAAGLDRHDPLDLDLRPAVAHADLVRELQRVVDELVRQPEDFEGLRLVEADAPLEDLLAGDVEDHAGISMGVNCPSGMRPRTGAISREVLKVAFCRQVGVAWPGADHDAEAGEAAALGSPRP